MSATVALACVADKLAPVADDADQEARLLVSEVLQTDLDRAQASNEPILADAAARLNDMVDRRTSGEPLAYVLGWVSFRSLRVRVDPRVVVPCDPPTGMLVDEALTLPAAARVIDVGTGSGAVALSIKHERPDLVVAGTDVSAEAVAVARGNAAALSLDVAFSALAGVPAGEFDLIVTNPPYARDDEIDVLGHEISGHQPHLALFGGSDGLDVLKSIIATAPSGTRVATEHDRGQTAAVHAFLASPKTRDDVHTTSSITVGAIP